MQEREDKQNSANEYKSKSNKPFKVLIVDDDVDLNEAIKNRLESEGIQAESCIAGEEVINKVSENDYGLVILDILLGDADGVSVFNKIIKLKPYLNVVFISAYSQDKIVQDAKKLPAIGFLSKPFRFDKLNKIIDTIQKGNKR